MSESLHSCMIASLLRVWQSMRVPLYSDSFGCHQKGAALGQAELQLERISQCSALSGVLCVLGLGCCVETTALQC